MEKTGKNYKVSSIGNFQESHGVRLAFLPLSG